MSPPSTTLRPAGTPSWAECASRSQCAVPSTCQMPFKFGLPSVVRGPEYARGVPWGACAVNRKDPTQAKAAATTNAASRRCHKVRIDALLRRHYRTTGLPPLQRLVLGCEGAEVLGCSHSRCSGAPVLKGAQ